MGTTNTTEPSLSAQQITSIRNSLPRTAIACFVDDAGSPIVAAPHHLLTAFVLERDWLGNSLIVAPPGHAKTWWTGLFFCSWKIGHDPETSIIYISNTAAHANRQSVAIRDTLADNEAYRFFFPHIEPDMKKGWGEIEWYVKRRSRNNPMSTFLAAGAGTAITGSRAKYIVFDDVNSEAEQRTPLQREKSREWNQRTALTRLVPQGRALTIQTRWHEEDWAGWCMDNKWTTLHFQAMADGDGPDQIAHLTVYDKGKRGKVDERLKNVVAAELFKDRWHFDIEELGDQEKGNHRWQFNIYLHGDGPALWPTRYVADQLADFRVSQGPMAWACIYQGKPAPEGGAVIPIEAFKEYDYRLPSLREQPWLMKVQAWDTAFSTKTSADYSVCETWALNRQGEFWLLDVYRKRAAFPDLKRAVGEQFLKHAPQAVLVEDAASGQSLIQELERTDEWLLQRVPVVRIKPDRDKVTRAHAVTGYIAAGKCFVPKNAPWSDDFINECGFFPNGTHDDQVDSMTMALSRLIRNSAVGMRDEDMWGKETVFGNMRSMEF